MLSIVADLKWFYERFSAYTHPNLHKFNILWGIMIESKLIPRFRSLWCHQRPGKLTTALGLRPRAVVSFPGRWWHHNDLNLGINSYNIQIYIFIDVHCDSWEGMSGVRRWHRSDRKWIPRMMFWSNVVLQNLRLSPIKKPYIIALAPMNSDQSR